jgi:CAAX protease family protein
MPAANNNSAWKKVAIFYVLTLALSVPFWWLLVRARGNFILVNGLMWAPGAAALLTQRAFGERFAAFGWYPGEIRYWSLAYVIPFLYVFPVYAIVWIAGLGGFDASAFVQGPGKEFGFGTLPVPAALIGYVLVALTAGFIAGAGGALGEELGWRGLLVPELSRVQGFRGTALISGFLWAIWHYPLVLFGGYSANAPIWFAMSCFTVTIAATGVIAAWIRLRSRSVWPAVILHASHNMVIQLIFTPMMTDTGSTSYWIDEFGIGLAITCTVGAVIVSMKARHWTSR